MRAYLRLQKIKNKMHFKRVSDTFTKKKKNIYNVRKVSIQRTL